MPPEDTPDDYMTMEEYHQGYMDAHPFNQDCEVCFGKGYGYDEIRGQVRCLDCQPDPLHGEQARSEGGAGS